MNILITGGAGYIGSHMALKLLDLGHKVTIIDNLSTGSQKLVPKKATFIKSNINNIPVLTKILKKNSFDALIHFAGFIQVEESIKYPKKYFTNNTKNSRILINTCVQNGLKNIIFSSTAAAYGDSKKFYVNENTKLNPINPYAKSKVLTENYLKKLNKNKKINFVILRYFNVAGADPKMRSGLISKKSTHLIKIASEVAIGKRKSITIFGNNYTTKDGTAIRDFIHVSDLAEIHIKSIKYLLAKKTSVVLNCGYGKGYSVKEIINKICLISNKKINIKYGLKRKGDTMSLVANVNKLMKTIKWTPKYNNIETILKTAIAWEKKLLNEKNL